jgi:hypothetical protein
VQNTDYKSVPHVTSSDHKPVLAAFVCDAVTLAAKEPTRIATHSCTLSIARIKCSDPSLVGCYIQFSGPFMAAPSGVKLTAGGCNVDDVRISHRIAQRQNSIKQY